MGGHILKHHNGVVDHHTNRYRECRKGYDVEGVACRIQVDERCNQRYGNGDGDNQRGSPAPKEEEHHNDNEQQGIHHCLHKGVDGVADVVGSVDNDVKLDIGRKPLLKRRKHGENFVGYFHGVGATLFLNHNHGSLVAVVVGLLGAFLQRVVDSCHVGKVDRTAIVATHNNVVHLAGAVELALHTQRICVGAHIEGTTGDVAVLGADHRGDLLDG